MMVNLTHSFIFLQKILQRGNASPEAFRKHQKALNGQNLFVIIIITIVIIIIIIIIIITIIIITIIIIIIIIIIFAHAQKMSLCPSAVTLSHSLINGRGCRLLSFIYLLFIYSFN